MVDTDDRSSGATKWALFGLLVGAISFSLVYLRKYLTPQSETAIPELSGRSNWFDSEGKLEPASDQAPLVTKQTRTLFVKVEEGATDCPAEYPVKVSRSGIYYTPEQGRYRNTTPRFCYADTDSATADGYRASK